MTTISQSRLFLAGTVATAIMTVLLYPAYVYGMPMADFATVFGGWLGHERLIPLSDPWWLGFGEHCFNGAVLFPLLYVESGYSELPTGNTIKGFEWGTLVFGLLQFFAVPMLGMGFFSMRVAEGEIFFLANLLGFWIYGAIFTLIAGPPARVLEESRREAPMETVEIPRVASAA